MSTPLIPLKSVLTTTKYTPAELTADRATEQWLLGLGENGLVLLRNLMNYYRDGATNYTHEFDSRANALEAVIVFTDYGYSVTGPGSDPDKTIIIDWS